MDAATIGPPPAADVPTSVAQLTLLQSALELLKACDEGFLEGQALSVKLRALHPEQVVEVTGYCGKARKGWLRQLLSQEPLISQVRVPGRSDVCYTLGSVPASALTSPAGASPGHGIKRGLDAVASGVSEPKRQRRASGPCLDLQSLAAKIPQGEREGLVHAAAEVLRATAPHQDHLEGNKISEALKERMPAAVEVVKAAVGGKGWLRALLETVPDIIRVDVDGKAEPCYRLVDGSVNYDVVPMVTSQHQGPSSPVPMMTPQHRRPPVASPMSTPLIRQARVGFAPHPAGLVAPAASALPVLARKTLMQAATVALANADRGFLEGNRLSEALRTSDPELVNQAKTSLGGKDGKGWLKRLLETEASIIQVQVENVKEPCYALAMHASSALGHAAAAPATTTLPSAPAMLATAAPSQATAEGALVLLEAAVATLSSVPNFLEGNKLSEALKNLYPELVETTKTAMGGKGWLKKMLEQEPRIVPVRVQGLHEPCYSLAERCAGGAVEFQAPTTAPSSRSRGLGGENILERVSEEDAAALFSAAVSVLESVGAVSGGHLEGSKLAERMKAAQPQLVERVKTQLRKGWLKAVLELEPRIRAVEVEGRNEPCYQLVSQ